MRKQSLSVDADVKLLEFLKCAQNHIVQVGEDWNDLQSRKNLTWSEGYLEKGLEIVFIFNRGVGGYAPSGLNLCARLRYDKVVQPRPPSWGNPVGVWGHDDLANNDQGAMFVGPVDLIEGPNGVLRSLCRFDFVKYEAPNVCESTFYESAIDGCLKALAFIPGREVGIVVPQIIGPVDSADEVVEGGSKVPKNVADLRDEERQNLRALYNKVTDTIGIRFGEFSSDAFLRISSHVISNCVDIARGPLSF